MATKIYIKKGCNNYRTSLKTKNYTVNVEFCDGNVLMGVPSQLVTDDPFLQFLLERDERFGKVWQLFKTIGGESDVAEDAAVADKAGKAGKAKSAKSKNTDSDVTVIGEVTNLTDAIDWMAERGRMCANAEDVKDAMGEMKVSFPNWK